MIELLPKPRKQNEPCFPARINRWGCRFMCLLAIAQIYLHKVLTPEQIMELDERGRQQPGEWTPEGTWTSVLGPHMEAGRREHMLINWAFEALGSSRLRGIQVGRMKGNAPVFWHKAQPFDFIIGHWDTGSKDGHWTLWDAFRVEIYDPWDPKYSPTLHEVSKLTTDKELLYRVYVGDA